MLIPLSSDNIAQYVAQYEAYKRQVALERGEDESHLRLYNGELEVDEYLSENMHLVWYGHFHRRFPHYWTLLPDMPPSEDNTLFLKEKAKVRYICQNCCHIWTSLNGCVKFWAATGHVVYFHLPGADCSQCGVPEQPALWYPDEVMRVVDNLYGFLNAGKVGRDEMESKVLYRRGVTRGLQTRVSTPRSSVTSESGFESAANATLVSSSTPPQTSPPPENKPIPLMGISPECPLKMNFSAAAYNKSSPRRHSRGSDDYAKVVKEKMLPPRGNARVPINVPIGA